MSAMRITVLSVLGALLIWIPVLAQARVTLGGSTSPSVGQAGVTTVSVTGSGFPSGTVPSTGVTVTVAPKFIQSDDTATAPSGTPCARPADTIIVLIRSEPC